MCTSERVFRSRVKRTLDVGRGQIFVLSDVPLQSCARARSGRVNIIISP